LLFNSNGLSPPRHWSIRPVNGFDRLEGGSPQSGLDLDAARSWLSGRRKMMCWWADYLGGKSKAKFQVVVSQSGF
jgi:hypothetical protein